MTSYDLSTYDGTVNHLQRYTRVRRHNHTPKWAHTPVYQIYVNECKTLLTLSPDALSNGIELEMWQEDDTGVLIPLWGSSNTALYYITYGYGTPVCVDLTHARKTVMRNSRDAHRTLTSSTYMGKTVWCGYLSFNECRLLDLRTIGYDYDTMESPIADYHDTKI